MGKHGTLTLTLTLTLTQVIGKHGRNTRLAVQRMYAIDARTRQRTGGGGSGS